MTDRDRWLRDFLLSRGIVSSQVMEQAWRAADHADVPLARFLLARGILSREELSRAEEHFQVTSAETVDSMEEGLDGGGPGISLPGTGVTPVRRLGAGAMGEVWLARDEQVPGRQVAVKLIRPELADDPEMSERFLREARAVAAIDHPNVIRIHRYGRTGGVPFLLMEFVEGASLDEQLKQGRGPDVDEAVRLVEGLARGVAAAHAAGVLHRDIKPGNVLVEAKSGRPILTDFGLARLEGARTLTKTGDLLGSPAYMAPEQARGAKQIDERTDVYGLGATLYRILAGCVPFQERGTVHAILDALVRGQFPRPLSEVAPDLDPALVAVCERAMAPNPGDRYASARAFSKALHAYREGGDVSGVEAPRRVLWVPGLLLLVLLALGGFLAWGPWPSGERPEEGASRETEITSDRDETSEKPGTEETRPNPAKRAELPPAWRVELVKEPTVKDVRRAFDWLHETREAAAGPFVRDLAVNRFVRACRILKARPRSDALSFLPFFLGLSRSATSLATQRETFRADDQRFPLYYRWVQQEATEAVIAVAGLPEGRSRIEDRIEAILRQREETPGGGQKLLARLHHVLVRVGAGRDEWLERAAFAPALTISQTQEHLVVLMLQAASKEAVRDHLERFRPHVEKTVIPRYLEEGKQGDCEVLRANFEATPHLYDVLNDRAPGNAETWEQVKAFGLAARGLFLQALFSRWLEQPIEALSPDRRRFVEEILQRSPRVDNFVPTVRGPGVRLLARWILSSESHRAQGIKLLRRLRERYLEERQGGWFGGQVVNPLLSYLEDTIQIARVK